MTNRNLPSLRAIATDPKVLAALSLDALDQLLSEAEAENKIISAAKRAITGHIETTYAGDIAHAYDVKGADFGAVHVSDGGYDIEVTTPKKVEWSQAELAAAVEKIRATGDRPEEYVTVTYAVAEAKYTAWPTHIREVFEPARTIRPGSRTIKLARKEAA